MQRWAVIVPMVVAALILGVRAETRFLATHPAQAFGDLLVSWSFIAAGVAAWWRRPKNRSGLLMMAVGFLWLVGNLRWVAGCSHTLSRSVLWTAGDLFQGLYAPVLLHL